MTTGGVWLIIALAAASATVVWLAASKGVSGRPQWWLVRGGTLAIGTTLLALAVLAPGVVGQLADLAFSGPASGDGAAGAELATRVLLAILALAVLTVPGT